jgi:hypothetical protein
MSLRGRLWFCWAALVFGLLNIYGPPIESFRIEGDPPTVSTDTLSQRTSFLDRLLIDLRDDYSSRFYYSIAQATLGRAYQPRYIHPYNVTGSVPQDSRFSDSLVAVDEQIHTPLRPLRPWRDFLLEYPPGMLAPILLPSLFTSDRNTYFIIFSLEMEFFLTLAVYFSVRTADLLGVDGSRALSQSIFLTAALGVIAVRRYDPCVAFAISGAIYALAARRPGLSGAALALGVALKGVPLVLAPVFAMWFGARRDWSGLRRAAASFAVSMAAVTIAYVVFAWPRVFESFAYHANRPIQMESIYSAFLMLVRKVSPDVMSIELSYGSYNIISAYEPLLRTVANIVVVAGILAAYAWAYRRISSAVDDRERLIYVIFAGCACLVAVISLGKVSNSQYLVWLIPVGALGSALSAGDGRWRLVIAYAVAQAVYPFLYTSIIAGRLAPIDGVIILARDFLLWRWTFKIANDPVAGSSPTSVSTPAMERIDPSFVGPTVQTQVAVRGGRARDSG